MTLPRPVMGFVLALLSLSAWGGDSLPEVQTASATPPGIANSQGELRLFKRDVTCRADSKSPATIHGAVLEPGRELNPAVDTLQPIVTDGHGGFVVAAGTTMLSGGLFRGGTDILLAGLDDDLSPRWATVFGGPLSENPVSIVRTRDGGYAAVSSTRSLWYSMVWRWVSKGDLAMLVSKYAADGTLEWVQYLTPGDDPGGASIVVPASGGVLVGGGARVEGKFPGFLLKTDDEGKLQWAHKVGSDHENTIAHLEALPNGQVLASGSHRKLRASPYDVWVGRFDGRGAATAAAAYHSEIGGSTGIAFPISDGGAIVIRSPVYQRTAPRSRIAVFALAADGTVRWSRLLDFDERVTLSNFAEAGPGRYLLFGGAEARADLAGPMMLELDAAGQVVGSRAIEIGAMADHGDVRFFTSDEPVSMARDPRGGYVILGNLVAVPVDVIERFGLTPRSGQLDRDVQSRLRSLVYLLRIGEGVPNGPCTREVMVKVSDQPVEMQTVDLPTSDLAAQAMTPVPRLNVGVEYLRP